ncbi:MAG: hypothetical protein ACRD0U_17490, partial [Acidimicrobiales bacterium]
MRRTVLALGLLAILTPAAAAKGGSWLYPLEDRYEPGEVATLDGWTSPGQLGWVEDGPFLAYLRVDPIAVAMTPSVGWPSIDPTDLALGPLRLSTRAGHVVA